LLLKEIPTDLALSHSMKAGFLGHTPQLEPGEPDHEELAVTSGGLDRIDAAVDRITDEEIDDRLGQVLEAAGYDTSVLPAPEHGA